MSRPTDLPERNVELLRATMRYVEKHPEEHDQEHWYTQCGTAFCYAGHAALLAGAARPTFAPRWGEYWTVRTTTLESVSQTSSACLANGDVAVDEFAASQLGITGAEAEALFDGNRTVEGLRALVDALCGDAWIDDDMDIHNVQVDGVDVAPLYVDDWLVDVGAE